MERHKDPKFNQLLSSWDVKAEAPTGFEREVWQRIAARAESPALTFTGALDFLVNRLIRPQIAATVVLFVVFSAATLGLRQASIGTERKEARVAQSYLNSIDPVTHKDAFLNQ